MNLFVLYCANQDGQYELTGVFSTLEIARTNQIHVYGPPKIVVIVLDKPLPFPHTV